jgi:hypothetical protein
MNGGWWTVSSPLWPSAACYGLDIAIPPSVDLSQNVSFVDNHDIFFYLF